MKPYIILFNAVSLDGRFDNLDVDLGQFYGLAGTWGEDASLAGCDTLLQVYDMDNVTPETEEDFVPPQVEAEDTRPWLVVPDSRGRLRTWHMLRKEPYWKDIVVLCSKSTPADHLKYLEERHIQTIVTGDDHVDYRSALEELNRRFGIKKVRVDSGGTLNGILLREGLVDEVSLLVHPALIGGLSPRSFFRAPDLDSKEGIISLKLSQLEKIGENLIWIKYLVADED